MPFVEKGGFGIYTGNKPKKIADTILDLFTNDRKLLNMSTNAKERSHPEATLSIAMDIGDSLVRLLK